MCETDKMILFLVHRLLEVEKQLKEQEELIRMGFTPACRGFDCGAIIRECAKHDYEGGEDP